MKKVLNLYKPAGITSLNTLEAFKKNSPEYPEYKDIKLGYAGTLDPLAKGVLIVLVGDENKEREKYIELDKEYKFSVLFGVSTDTYDVLGKIDRISVMESLKEKDINNILEKFKGKILQEYPPYSSFKVDGRALFEWSREGKIDDIDIPKAERQIYKIELQKIRTINKDNLKTTIKEKIKCVRGNFRQDEIITLWDKFFEVNRTKEFLCADLEAHVSSGTYIRALVNDLGEELGISSVVLDLERTKVGDYKLENSLKFNLK